MGRKTKLWEAKQQRAERAVCAWLQAHSRRSSRPAVLVRCDDFQLDRRCKIERYREFALRSPDEWRCRLKSRSPERRFLDLVDFTFARYPVPAHLRKVWIDGIADDFVDDTRTLAQRAAECRHPRAQPDLVRWYLIATQGGSLHKRAAHPYLSKLETHHFLSAPPEVGSAQQALWYAIARAHTDDKAAALKVAHTKLSEIFSIASSFWKDAARFFARNPASAAAMNDLIDYIAVMKEADAGFSLKGRTLATLQRRMEQWHRALTKQHAICGGVWAGRAQPDIDYEAGSDAKKAIWRFRQIKTGNDLFREGQRMHHCVASYKYRCVNGDVSIWSLTSEFPIGRVNKGVTLELRKDGAIVQCRGFANRLPYPNFLY
jgi:PcfJ-like protein